MCVHIYIPLVFVYLCVCWFMSVVELLYPWYCGIVVGNSLAAMFGSTQRTRRHPPRLDCPSVRAETLYAP